MIEVFPMQEADLEQVTKIEHGIFTKPWSQNAFLDSMTRKDTIYLVAKEVGIVMGYCGGYCSFDELEITNVAVKQEYRRHNIGRRLVERLIQDANKQGVTRFLLEVRESNQGAIALYESLGFHIEGVRKNFYEKPTENALIMWKT